MSVASRIPHPVATFVGREAELARMLSLIGSDTLSLVCGVAGVGKSEFAYALSQAALVAPEWKDAKSIYCKASEGDSLLSFLTELLTLLGGASQPDLDPGTSSDQVRAVALSDQITERLQQDPHILLLEDLHHLSGLGIATLLSNVARHVRTSRVLVTTREALRLEDPTLSPALCMLEPLGEEESAALVRSLAQRLHIECPDWQLLYQSSHGSPFYLRHALAKNLGARDTLAESLAELSAEQRAALLLAAIMRVGAREGFSESVLSSLEARLLVDSHDAGRLSIHDLVRDTVLRLASNEDKQAAHAEAAQICERRLREDASSLEITDCVAHRIAAGQFEQAWECVEKWRSHLASRGEDHLLMKPLEVLRDAYPAEGAWIDLVRAQCLLRAARVDEAARLLSQMDPATLGDRQAQYHGVRAGVAQRRGELAEAAEQLRCAIEAMPEEGTRFRLQVQAATLASMLGQGEQARKILEEGLKALKVATPRQIGLYGWGRSLSWIFAEHYELAAAQAQETLREIAGHGLVDLESRLAMIRTVACVDSDRMAEAQEAAQQISQSGVRKQVARLYRCIAAYAGGQDVSDGMREVQEYFQEHGDSLHAFFASYYGSACCLAAGRLAEARARAEEAEALAKDAGLESLRAQALAQQALLASEGIQDADAHRLADAALEREACGPRTRGLAHCAHAHAYILEGDISSALQAIDDARRCLVGEGLAFARVQIDVEEAAVRIVGGEAEKAISLAGPAARHYLEHRRDFEAARTQLLLAAAHIASGKVSDLVLAGQEIASAKERAERGDMRFVQVGCVVLSAALRRAREPGTFVPGKEVDERLLSALEWKGGAPESVYGATLLAAIEGYGNIPGVLAFLVQVGLCEPRGCYIVGPDGRRAASTKDLERERSRRQLFVDALEEEIFLDQGKECIRGRSIMCGLLRELILGQGKSISAIDLYERVWEVEEYHPLRHRNTLYVAINRLRKTLSSAFGDEQLVERAKEGWRLAPGLDAAVAIAMPTRPSSSESSGNT